MAQPLHRPSQDPILGDQPLEVLPANLEQLDVAGRPGQRGARAAAEQCHLAERLAVAQGGDGPVTFQYFDFAARDDIEGVAGIAGAEEDLPRLQPAGAHTG